MRDATKEERESVDRYIKSISHDTGVRFDDLISKQVVIDALIPILSETDNVYLAGRIIRVVNCIPVVYDVEKVIERITERMSYCAGATKYGNENAGQQKHSYSQISYYEVAQDVEDIIDIVREGGVNE